MIECTNFKPHEIGFLKGFADLYVPKWDLEIKGCALFKKNGHRWINMPSKEYEDESGERKFSPIVRFRNKEYMTAFTNAAKEAIDKWCEENPQEGKEQIEEPATDEDFF